ncbi:MAG: dehypoxanthine futalosine cyclase [Candidatus Schekmanbacteria bacterium]|nr:dehypoxanthine futalosine cyclase [Candidatus Schekmanbacteria bacterium]
MGNYKNIAEKVEKRQRISTDECLELLKSADFFLLGRLANNLRLSSSPTDKVTYVVDRNINFTNICVSECAFCAFYKNPESKEGYVLPDEEIFRKIEEAVKAGATQILMQGGLNPSLSIDYYEGLLRKIKSRFPVHIHSFSPPEIVFIAKTSEIHVKDVLLRLRDAGLDTIPGGGAEILVDRVRQEISPHKCNAGDWLDVMRRAHELGIGSTATMMFGHVESLEERITHLLKIRELQDETGGFRAFIPWTFQWENTKIGKVTTSAIEYLRTVAISRIFLDNIKNIQASWVTQGPKISQLSLMFGANDFGGTMMEENVVRMAGASFRMTEKEIIELIKHAGFVPARRDTNYNVLEVMS